MRPLTRPVVGIAVAAVATAWGASSASAHIDPDPKEAPAGSEQSVGFTVEHGCEESATIQLDMRLPDGVTNAVPEPPAGWTASVARRVVTFVGGPLPADVEGTFRVRMTLPATPDTTIYFPFVQRCEQGEIRWIDVPSDGSGTELDEPAPAMNLTAPLPTTTTTSPPTTTARPPRPHIPPTTADRRRPCEPTTTATSDHRRRQPARRRTARSQLRRFRTTPARSFRRRWRAATGTTAATPATSWPPAPRRRSRRWRDWRSGRCAGGDRDPAPARGRARHRRRDDDPERQPGERPRRAPRLDTRRGLGPRAVPGCDRAHVLRGRRRGRRLDPPGRLLRRRRRRRRRPPGRRPRHDCG